MAERLPQNPEVKILMVSWAFARLNGALSGVVAGLLEFGTKARAYYFLARKHDRGNRGPDVKGS